MPLCPGVAVCHVCLDMLCSKRVSECRQVGQLLGYFGDFYLFTMLAYVDANSFLATPCAPSLLSFLYCSVSLLLLILSDASPLE